MIQRAKAIVCGRLPLIFLMALLIPSFASSALAADAAPAIGMNSGEVQRIWGEPEERQLYETKREELWSYDQSEVRFREGKVVAWRYFDEGSLQGTTEANGEVIGTGDEKDVAVADILTEIMNELPEGQ